MAAENDDTEEPADEDLDEDRPELERRTVRSEIKDRIGPIRRVLARLQDTYLPLNSLYGLRIPSAVGHGSHDLYQEGRITNRDDTFEDHRNMVRYLYRTYKTILERTEESAWFAFEQHDASASTRTSHGNTFHRLVANVQRYVCPKVEVWLGATPFQELMESMGPTGADEDVNPTLNRRRV